MTSAPDIRQGNVQSLYQTGEQTNPDVGLPPQAFDTSSFADEPEHHTREIKIDTPSLQPSHPEPRQRGGADTPPWLISEDDQVITSPSFPEHEVFRNDLFMAPPEAEDIAALRQASLMKKLRKVALPAAIAVVVIVGVVLLWPRPDPVSTLDIRSHPPGAQVYIDGELQPDVTPATIGEIPTGSVHQVELRLDGFTPWSQAVQLNAEEVRQIAVLSPIRGTLRVTSEPSGASVIIDGVYRGQTPHVVDGLDINRAVEIQVRYEESTQTQTLVWGGRTEATAQFTFESRQRRRGSG